jgi:hypothetical protein
MFAVADNTTDGEEYGAVAPHGASMLDVTSGHSAYLKAQAFIDSRMRDEAPKYQRLADVSDPDNLRHLIPKRQMKSTFIALILAVVPLAMVASARDRVWQTGKVLDTRENVWFAGVTSWSDTYGTRRERTTVASSRARYGVWQYSVIEGDTTVYQARERLWWRWSKSADVAVNGAVRYAVDISASWWSWTTKGKSMGWRS